MKRHGQVSCLLAVTGAGAIFGLACVVIYALAWLMGGHVPGLTVDWPPP